MQFPLQAHFPAASRLVFGCMQLGGDWDRGATTALQHQRAFSALDAAIEGGITCFDHADIYTLGKSERVFGDYLRQSGIEREQLFIQSKCGIRLATSEQPGYYDFSAAHIRQSVDASLQRLGCDYLDLLLLHRPDPLMQPREVAAVFSDLHAQGKVRAFGVSNMAWPQLQWLQQALEQPLIANQLEMSLANYHWLEETILTGMPAGSQCHFSAGTVEFCQLRDIQLQAWGSLAQGLFSGGRLPRTDAEHKTATLVQQLAADYQVSAEAIVLAWLLRHPAAIQPVIGSLSVARIQACLQATQIELSREHWYRLYCAVRGQALP
ncbi:MULTISPECIES: aldo/keto reductase [Alkalimonas]|uniref:Aldo/keto reductase n=1 Tax=Alkalimonas mucilaginosa TaxID=3057676 RepID=A0ABU7JHR2_9GAMM|nr:aldo/keto reductase [Alkalimonas sp. MEB004]MEE2025231.1 aldo/keto reductase [Alkalimonas sp. MEB004]